MIFLRLFSGWMVQIVPFALLCFRPFMRQLRFSAGKTLTIMAGLWGGLGLAFALGSCALYDAFPHNTVLFTAVNILFMASLIPCFLWYLYAVKAHWLKKLFVFSYVMTGAFAITSIANTILTKVYLGLGHNDGLPYRGVASLVLLLLTSIFLPVLSLILKQSYQTVEDSFTQRESAYLSVLSILLLVILALGMAFFGYTHLYNPLTILLYAVLLVSGFAIYAIFFKMLSIAHEKLTAQQKYDEAQRQLTIQEAQYRQITENMESTRRMRHDLRHHLLTLQGFLKSGEVERAEQYLSQTLKISEEYEIVKLCRNAVVNLVVGHYQALAKEQDVRFSARITIPDDIPILDADLSVVIGNLLENALYAAGREQNAFIRFNMICSGKMLAVTVDNSFSGTVCMSDGKYLSTKEGHIGYGLQSVEAIAEKYSGGVEFTHEDRVFHSSVMMGMHTPTV